MQEAVERGPGALSNAQKAALLGDPLALSRLHFQVWTSEQAHADWFGALRAAETQDSEPAPPQAVLTPVVAG
jgi:membrane glycosyltransferase